MRGECIEGWLVRASLGGATAYFMVKGYEHPETGFIAVPYRAGARRILEPMGYAWRIYPWLLEYLDCMPRPVPVIREGYIVGRVDPERAIRARWDQLPGPIRRIIEMLEYEWIGLTGSWALGLEGPESDVDILVYGRGVYESLAELASRGLITACPPRPDRIREPSASMLFPIKLVESCWGGIRVTLRILRSTVRLPCKRRIPLGPFEALVELVDVGESYLVPARYIARIISLSRGPHVDRVALETWRTRYQELPPGLYEVRGVAWLEEGDIIVSPDIGGSMAPKAWESTDG